MLAAAALAGTMLLDSCALAPPGTPGPGEIIPTRDEALALFQEAVERAQREDFEHLCDLGGGNCERILANAGELPPDPPLVAGIREVPSSRRADGSVQVGGQLLTACGMDASGRRYVTEMIVFYSDGMLRIIEPVYWSGMGIGEGPGPEPSRSPGPACP